MSDPVPGGPIQGVDGPAATRIRLGGWRDPRLVLGLALLAVCVLLGSRLLGRSPGTVEVWSARHDLAAGVVLTRDEVVPRRIAFPDGGPHGYLRTDQPIPPRFRLAEPVRTGQLVPAWTLRSETSGPVQVSVPLAVAPDDLPSRLGPGALVDVWALPDAGAARRGAAVRVFTDAVVLSVSAVDPLAGAGTRRVVVSVAEGDGLAAELGRLAAGRLLLTVREQR